MNENIQNRRLIIISNRLPVSVSIEKDELVYNRSLGGLAIGLDSFHKNHNSIWIGWPGITSELIENHKKNIKNHLINIFDCYPIFLTQEEREKYYEGFCNKTVWPLFHYFRENSTFDDNLWNVYKDVNKKFYEIIIEVSKPNDIIWIQDYHLMLLPKLIRDHFPNATIGFFLHIPFPSYELFRLLPWREDILKGLLGSDLIGFHTYDYERHFLSSVHKLLHLDYTMNQLLFQGRTIKIDCFPMGIDYDRYNNKAKESGTKNELKRIREEIGDKKVILSVDRMDYTKGILQRLDAYECFLNTYPEYREKIILIFIIAPSRSKVEEYQDLKKEIDEIVGKINGKFGKIEWNPIQYIYRPLNLDQLVVFYLISDIILITPIRDGMNLIVKEYIASKIDNKGVLILSETTGAAKQLYEAIIVNTNNKKQIIDAIKEALEMPEIEQIERMKAMKKRIKNYNVTEWAEDIIESLIQVKTIPQDKSLRFLTTQKKEELILKYKNSNKRLIFLDYDGTLIKFYRNPKNAKPNDRILSIVKDLVSDSSNIIFIISGRDKQTLSKWFKGININLVAEHGLWTKNHDDQWKTIEYLNNNWKDQIRPVLRRYVNRTPGSFIEEKEFCLVWHYRNVESDLSNIRSKELVNLLENLTSNEELTILEGNKVVEIKNSDINKGKAISRIITNNVSDFTLIIGDDTTDEDMFEVGLTIDNAFSIKVGYDRTKAHYNLFSVDECLKLLEDLNSINK